MTTFEIKLIAITLMLIDHVGYAFFPQIFLLRIIGRLAFPLFAWLIANGAHHSKNPKKYLLTLLAFAFISETPFILLNRLIDPTYWQLNALFTLSLGLGVILWIRKTNNKFLSLLIIAGGALSAYFLNTDYGMVGVLSVVGFYLTYGNLTKTIIVQIALFITFYTIPAIWFPLDTYTRAFYYIEPLGLLALTFIAAYNQKQGRKMKYVFYLFYPTHLFLLYLIKLFI